MPVSSRMRDACCRAAGAEPRLGCCGLRDKGTVMIPIARPLIGAEEEAAVLAVLRSGQLAAGDQVQLFERRFAEVCQVREAVAVANGTAALHLALLAHGIGPGDEVITSPLSFAATGNTILLVGARPVFVDVEPD